MTYILSVNATVVNVYVRTAQKERDTTHGSVDAVIRDRSLLDVAFAAELVGLVVGVSPLDVRFLVLPVPRLRDDDVSLVYPRTVLHPTGNPAQSLFAVDTAEADVVPAQVLCHHGEHFVIGGHSEVPTP